METGVIVGCVLLYLVVSFVGMYKEWTTSWNITVLYIPIFVFLAITIGWIFAIVQFFSWLALFESMPFLNKVIARKKENPND